MVLDQVCLAGGLSEGEIVVTGVMVYIAGLGAVYCALYYALATGVLAGYRGKVAAVLSVLVLGFIAIFRGDVGTDTADYEVMVSDIRSTSERRGIEPGFAGLVSALGWVIASDGVVVRLLAVCFVIGLLVFIWRADRDEMFFLLAYFLPSSFYSYSMNALRIGLATVFFLFAIQFARRRLDLRAICSFFVGWAFHFSLVLSAAYTVVAAKFVRGFMLAVLGAFSAVFGAVIAIEYWGYFVQKIAAYSDMPPPGELSGLGPVVTLLVVVAGGYLSELKRKSRIRFLVLSLVAVFLSFWLSRYTYAGLRLLDLLTVAVPGGLLLMHGREAVAFNDRVTSSLVLAGGLGAAAMLRGFVLSAREGGTPWIPYELFF